MNEHNYLGKWLENLNIPPNAKLRLSIFTICFIGLGLSVLYIWIAMELKCKLLIAIFASLMLYSIACKIKSKKTIITILCYIMSIPIQSFYLWLKYMQPSFTISLAYILLGLYSFGIPFLISKGLSFFFQWHFTMETIIFLTLSIGSIVSVHCNFIIHWIIKEWSPLKNWGNHKYEGVRTDLALYVTSKNNIHCIISFSYVIFLIYTSFIHIQYNEVWITKGIDTSIQKAFIVFIAFSTMMTKRKDVEIKAQPLFDKIQDLIKMEHK